MEVRTYRAATMHAALALVRCDLGPDAAVLHTREVPVGRFWGRLFGRRQIEVTASLDVNVPSRFGGAGRSAQHRLRESSAGDGFPPAPHFLRGSEAHAVAQSGVPGEVQGQLNDLQTMVKELCRRSTSNPRGDLPDALFRLFTDLIDAELNEDLARELVEQVRGEASDSEMADLVLMKARIARRLETEIHTGGPIAIRPGTRRIVALVGPTGVGKTTTIAKLAAHYRLKEKRKVGLITVDTYRIAAVEQLRTYADIIDLPMQVVSTPRDMREAVRRMEGLELLLMDTAGRSPKDEVKIRELGAFLTEAAADEVHLVLSAVGNPRTLVQTAEHFAPLGTTSLILTKLDEATGLGNLLPLLRSCRLSLRYLTNGQNVPDDIETADPRRLTALMLGLDLQAQTRCF